MPPHLHPRSRSTLSLFTTTLFVSFLVVGLPHVLPCPANRREFADGDMSSSTDPASRPPRRRRKDAQILEAASGREVAEQDLRPGARSKRECLVPKPAGKIGEVLGFKAKMRKDGDGDDDRPTRAETDLKPS
ncbi:MAG: U3 snoRNP protein [Chaenotheca gracillima]|nr:MAG: U3 snoRNP protein [Chaenotheca gracillima]